MKSKKPSPPLVRIITFVGRPDINSVEATEVGGAMIDCYVAGMSADEAVEHARREIHETRWHIESLDDVGVLVESDFDDDPTGKEYFDQALIDGFVMMFHTWPNNDPDDIVPQ